MYLSYSELTLYKVINQILMRRNFTLITFLIGIFYVNAQVGINTESPKASLDIVKTDNPAVYDGVIAPRLSASTINSKDYTVEQTGAIVYINEIGDRSSLTNPQLVQVVDEGYYYFDGAKWVSMNNWSLTGNVVKENVYDSNGRLVNGNFIGTLNDQDFVIKRNNKIVGIINSNNISLGENSFKGKFISSPPTNSNIIAIGSNALENNKGGNNNIGIGGGALRSNSEATNNVGIGFGALSTKLEGNNNVSVGVNSTRYMTNGRNNTALGQAALFNIVSGEQNTAIGGSALQGRGSAGDKGNGNTAVGYLALNNTFFSELNLGNYNTALGRHAGINVRGNNNIFIGNTATKNEYRNASLGTGDYNKITTLSNYMNIGDVIFANDILNAPVDYENAPAGIPGKVGLGNSNPQYRLDVKAIPNEDPIRVDGIKELESTAQANYLVIDNNNIIKKSSVGLNNSSILRSKLTGSWSLLTLSGGWSKVPLNGNSVLIGSRDLINAQNEYVVPADGIYQVKYELRIKGVNAGLLGTSYIGLFKNGETNAIEDKELDGVSISLLILDIANVPVGSTMIDTILELKKGDRISLGYNGGGINLGLLTDKIVDFHIYKISN